MQTAYNEAWNDGFNACFDIVAPVITAMVKIMTEDTAAGPTMAKIEALAAVQKAIDKVDRQIAEGR